MEAEVGSLTLPKNSESRALYSSHAELYDKIYHFKPYAREAERIHELLARHGVPDGSRILEAACGTGGYLVHLKDWYRIAGFDLCEEMISIASCKLPGADLFVEDMAGFEVEEPFDALLCLFSSIGYLLADEDLEGAARSFAGALRPGGILLVEPFLSPGEYEAGRPVLQTYDGEDLKCARAYVPGLDGDRAILEYHWLVMRKGKGEVEHLVERHELLLRSVEEMVGILERFGFSTEIEASGLLPNRPIIIAHSG